MVVEGNTYRQQEGTVGGEYPLHRPQRRYISGLGTSYPLPGDDQRCLPNCLPSGHPLKVVVITLKSLMDMEIAKMVVVTSVFTELIK